MLGLALAACGTPEHPPPVVDPGGPSGAGVGAASPSARDAAAMSGDASEGTRAGNVVVLASNQPGPQGLASDGTFLYFTTNGRGSKDGAIQRVTLGRQDVTPLAVGFASPGEMILANSDLYWLNQGVPPFATASGSVARLPIAGGAPQTIAQNEIAPAFLTADASSVYWTSNAFGNGVSVERAPRGGGRTAVLTTYTSPFLPGGVAVDARFVYFLAHGEGLGALFRASIVGEAPEVLWHSDAGEPIDLVLAGSILYWVVDDAPPNGAVLAMPINGTQPTRIARAQNHPVRLAVRDGFVYYVTSPPRARGQLLRVPTSGGAAPELVLSDLDAPRGLLVDTRIHVTTRDQVLEISK